MALRKQVGPRTLIAMASVWVLLTVLFAPAASSQSDEVANDEPTFTTADGHAGGQANTDLGPVGTGQVIPGFYGANTHPVPVFLDNTGFDLDPLTGWLWSTTNDDIRVYDSFLRIIGTAGTGQLSGAAGVAIADGEVFVADSANDRVQVFNSVSGAYQRTVGGAVLEEPCGIEVVNDLVYATHAKTSIFIFAANGSVIDQFDGTDSGTQLSMICRLDSLASDGNHLYVADYNNGRVAVFDLDGNWLRDINTGGNPSAIDIAAGRIWLTDWNNHTVSVWTLAGSLVGDITSSGAGLGQIVAPHAIWADPAGDAFWLGEHGANQRNQVFTNRSCRGSLLTHVGTSYNDILGGTSDTMIADLGAGHDSFSGTFIAETVCGSWGSDRIDGGEGNDTIDGGQNSDILWGGTGNDVIWGGEKGDKIYGGDGHDTIYAESGADLVFGGPDNDMIFGNNGGDRLFGQGGVDTIYGGNNGDKIYGGQSNDWLYGGSGADRMWGGTGHDNIFGESGDDSHLDGDEHNDKVYGGNGNDVVHGGDGRDKVYGQNGNDDVRAQAGDDLVTDGGPGTDTCQTAPGIDAPPINCE